MIIEQYVMAYEIDQDRIRAILPEGFTSLRPVLRINAEVYDNSGTYLEFNTPVEKDGIRGWLNIGAWNDLRFEREGKKCTFRLPFLDISFTAIGISGSCPAQEDNEGTFFIGRREVFKPAVSISAGKEFCDTEFKWKFNDGDAEGSGHGPTISVSMQEIKNTYPKGKFTPENAAAIPCIQVLGGYVVMFEKENETRSNAMKNFAKLINGEI